MLTLIVRPSGTEPKIKAHLQVVLDASGNDVRVVRRRAAAELDPWPTR